MSDELKKSIAHQIVCDNTPHFDGLLVGVPHFDVLKASHEEEGDTVAMRFKTITGSEVSASVTFHPLGAAPVSMTLDDTLTLPRDDRQDILCSSVDRLNAIKRVAKTVGKHYPALESIALANLAIIYNVPPTRL